jgi:acyl transferase domain-containing protein/NADP-dependent 3-hydroxy acid dehydrogenase YdfG
VDRLQAILHDLKCGRIDKAEAHRRLDAGRGRRDAVVSLFAMHWREQGPGRPFGDDRQRLLWACEQLGPVDAATPLCAGQADAVARFETYAAQLLAALKALPAQGPEVLVQVAVPAAQETLFGLSGLLLTAQLENPRLRGQVIGLEGVDDMAAVLRVEGRQADALVRYRAGVRSVMVSEACAAAPAGHPWRDGGVYLITGGSGGLGMLFARDILRHVGQATVILAGRSPQPAQPLPAPLRYRQIDVADAAAVSAGVRAIREEFGALNGILHCAGVLRDGYLRHKSAADLRAVLAPKVRGLVNLDQASDGVGLDLFVAFSSLAGVTGNVGQADYAAANAFMDRYAAGHARLLSINWPLWADGGMRVDAATADVLRESMGLTPLATQDGLRAFYQAVAGGARQVLVAAGDSRRIDALLKPPARVAAVAGDIATDATASPAAVLAELKVLFAATTRFPAAQLDAFEPLSSYGIDSIMITRLNQKLGAVFGALPKTLLYEYRTLAALADYLCAHHPAACRRWRAPAGTPAPLARSAAGVSEPIAIVGISGRYPQARTLAEYWDNLKAGRDCIAEIPDERWPLPGFFEPDHQLAVAQGRSYSKWGGFIDGFAEFDPLFFGISPREAEGIDPQERLFIQACWEVLEDAALTRETIASRHRGRVGVFAGITKSGFSLYGPELWQGGETLQPRTSFSSLANRVSYLFNLNGPSLPVDTMCSSSLTAVHQACEALRHGDCELAIAGGVNLYLHPSSYVELSAAHMLSADGRCKSFGRGGDGFVPGEGVGCVLLKPLARAIADGDPIHAVIRATQINHGGKTNGYTVPNPAAQRELIRAALDKAGIDARSIGYVEAHGTGTEMGDPIEIAALTEAFRVDTADSGYCAIGSSKSNIGHLEAAAGIAGLTRIVLQFRHRQLAPSLHAAVLNPHIDFAHSPFFVQQQLAPWPRGPLPLRAAISSFGAGGANAHVLLEEYVAPGTATPPPRPAAVLLSARGEAALRDRAAQLLAFLKRPGAAPASALTEALRGRLAALLHVDPGLLEGAVPLEEYGVEVLHLLQLQEEFGFDGSLQDCPTIDAMAQRVTPGDERVNLADLAYTLQIGREAMPFRLGCVATSVADLTARLEQFLSGDATGVQLGRVSRPVEAQRELDADPARQRRAASGDLAQMLELWLDGQSIDWVAGHAGVAPRRISLPTYPFARNRYWIGDRCRRTAPVPVAAATAATAATAAGPRVGDEFIVQTIIDKLNATLNLAPGELRPDQSFADYGLDSILGVNLVHALNEAFGIALATTCLFDYSSVDKLSAHVRTLYQEDGSAPLSSATAAPDAARGGDEAIAIIGISGRFPKSDKLPQLWRHLADGRDLVEPVSRWPLPDDGGCRHGGFVDGIDQFDALFFNISGLEASYMDPQQRLFLQEAWQALEDAGYAGAAVAGSACGVYVGCCAGDYQDLFLGQPSAQSLWGNMAAVIPSRIAYYLDLKGPALAIDTACSSSLVAIDLACKDLRNGEVAMALAGGVFLQATPKLYTSANRAGMLSASGHCHAFDAAADGFVPGEGAGVLLLKRLADAEADGDHIYGVIRASGVNQDGTTNGITAPSARSQEALLRRIYDRFGIDAAQIRMVEAHGTGTRLGDPIEFGALSKAFRADSGRRQYCALGSVKTNIGHSQYAAGVAGVLKVVLALQHRQIPPSLHYHVGNPAIDFADSPFFVNTTLLPWPEGGRLAAVSSFGAGGTNAHLVIGEAPVSARRHASLPAYLVVLSARSERQLRQQAEQLLTFCRQTPTLDLGNLSFTLIGGRKHFEYRLAVVVGNFDELCAALAAPRLQAPSGRTRQAAATRLWQQCVERLPGAPVYRSELENLAEAYLDGAEPTCAGLFGDGYCRLPLPTYPFARDRYWIAPAAPAEPAAAVHPLLQRKLGDRCFATRFTGREFFLADHQVQGKSIMPGVVALEMARAAFAAELGHETGIRLRDVVWLRPLAGPAPEIRITLDPVAGGSFEFRIGAADDPERVYSQGLVEAMAQVAPHQDLAALRAACAGRSVTRGECYAALRAIGIEHGERLQAVREIHAGAGLAVARLELPDGAAMPVVLHPSLLDAAIQAAVALLPEQRQTALPFALQTLEVFAPCAPAMSAVIRRNATQTLDKYDIDLCDERGQVCVRMLGYSARVLETGAPAAAALSVLLQPVWDAQELPPAPSLTGRMLVIGASPAVLRQLQRFAPQVLELGIDDSVAQIAARLAALDTFDHLLWVGGAAATAEQPGWQEHGVLRAFRLIKALLGAGHDARGLHWTLITSQCQPIAGSDPVLPADAALHGLFGSLAKEYPNWLVRIADVEIGVEWPLEAIFGLPFDARGDAWVWRRRQWHRRQLVPLSSTDPGATGYRQGGVYVVIGGAGGVGAVWTDYVVRRYQASVIWIGRSRPDAALQARIDAFGGAVHYVSADATDYAALAAARAQIERAFGPVHGVVHSAIVLLDQSLARMDEQRFLAAYRAKAAISVRIGEVFGPSRLDFVLFFSSIQSFARMPGQSNYAAGCTFKDAFACYLGQHGSTPVKVMNWGYWGRVGIVAGEQYQQRMAQAGLASIEAPVAMAALETLLGGGAGQLALVRSTRLTAVDGINSQQSISVYPQTFPSCLGQLEPALPPQQILVDELRATVGAQMSDLDVLLARLLFAQLREIGLFAGQGIAAMKARLPPLYARWFDESLVVLMRHGWIDTSAVALRSIDGAAAWADWEHAKAPWLQDANRRAQVLLVDTMLRALPDILNQKHLATDAMFPDSSLRLVEGIYKNNLVADYFNAVLSDVLLAYLGQRLAQDPKARIRILEIGAGTGGTSAQVFAKLSRYRNHLDEYCYTDLSKAFLMHAQREYGPGNPYLSYQRFDVGLPIAAQQIAAGAFDVVIASNVLHATRNIRTTLRNAKAALRRNGVLLLNELSDNVLFSHLTFGLLEGWWLYDDAALRIPGSPGLSPQSWKSVLEDEGFGLVAFPAAAAHGMGQQIIVAESDGVVRQATPFIPESSGEPLRAPSGQAEQKPAEAAPPPTGDLVRDKARSYFRELVGETIRIPASEIEACEPLERYGIDSILVVQLTSRLRSVLPDISSTLFFEVQSIDGLIEHLLATQPAALAALLDVATPRLPPASSPLPPPSLPPPPVAAAVAPVAGVRSAARSQDIAIIGLAGRYPQAGNVERFWQNLREGRNCITEIPAERWNWRDYFDPEPGKSGAMYSRFGGFLDDVGHFDPLFFHLSPAEAERMDPQERLFLLQAYSAIEDAGYTPQSLGGQRKVGVFVGVMNGRYPTGAAFWSVANRVSYLLNLTGPSLSVDTACSSSLTALHLAIESINSGMSDCAIAGGVNLILDPQHFVTLSEMVMLSPSDECKSFGAQADGFIDGEGVGALVLKPLADALAAGDQVYGIVRGSAINAGGKTHSYTVPSPVAQARVVSEACARADVAPRTISYIEAHGTGTALGDPIEIAGLTRAFRASTEDRQFCAVGSVKSNIGHCESAAGLAGITKVLMQFRHAQLAPSLHADSLNPEIDFANSPFTLQRALGPWPRPLIEGREYPRRAGISSFGAGGANAHVVLEEFVAPERAAAAAGPQAIVLSAKNDERLRVLTQNLLSFLETHPDTRLADLAFTLQVGRVAMDHRLALVADSLAGVQEHLRAYLHGGSDAVYHGQLSGKRDALAASDGDSEMRRSLAAWAAQGRYDKLLPRWVQGANFDWSDFGIHAGARRISLPTYPFAAEHYWIARAEPRTDAAAPFLHPLVHTNSSDLDGLRFSSTFSGGESFLADHLVQGRRVLPGVAYLEMARVAVNRATRVQDARIVLGNVVWERPFVVEEGQSAGLHVGLSRQPDGSIAFRIYSDAALHSHGRAQIAAPPPAATLDLSVLQARMTRARFSAEQCYAAFATLGIAYGPAHRGLQTVYAGSGEALARLDLPATADAFVLPPGLVDSALQASLALLLDAGGALAAPTAMLPFALARVEILAPCAAAVWAWVAASGDSHAGEQMQKLDITLCDADGQVCARLLGFAARRLTTAQGLAPAADSSTDAALKERTGRYLKGLLARATRLAAERIAVDTPLEEYGLDSVMVIKLTSELEKTFGALSKTLFFEHKHLDELADYFVTAHAGRLRTLFGAPDSAAVAAAAGSAAVPLIGVERTAPPVSSGGVLDVAIIGLSGRYPMAASLEQFWANLRDGVDCITEVPAERWDHSRYYHPDRSRQGATNSKWGGFLDGVDQFDPLFFNISPRDAEIIDPQERLFLEGAYHAIEDAGYTRHSLTESGHSVGVYVGVMYEEYQLYGAEQTALGRPMALSGSPSSIANRVSYFFDLDGPSMAVDSMCSSSLTAIHLACQALQQGDCSMAIAGGVNLTLHPNKYLALGQGRFASSQGRCRSFGEGGDGYVPSEGVGVLLLKPLAQAIADGDHIYGVVRGSAINHGGKTNAYTVPNPQAQAGVIARAYARAGISPRTVSYVEAHGTGTALGDPIEIAGLSSSFRDDTADTGFCAIGSVKSNIGHCESAAGVAGVTKVLLQLKHRQLVPSLHAATLNANIDFDSTPFVVQQHLGPWQRPRIAIDGALVEVPLRAGVSSFGAGGSNAHLIIEEYVAAPPAAAGDDGDGGAVVVVLSARTTEQLAQLARKLLDHLETEQPRLRALAYTLQLGREAMDERFGLVVSSLAELRFGLRQFLDGSDATGAWFRGNIKAGKGALSAFRDEDLQGAIAAWVDKRKYDKLLELWVQGMPLDWRRLYGGPPPARISLPVYPFARARYWIPGTGATLPAATATAAEHAAVTAPPGALDGVVLLHPCWREQAPASSGEACDPGRQLVLCCGAGSVTDARCEVIDCAGVDSGARFAAAAGRVFEVLQGLLREKPRSDVLLQVVVPLDGEGALFAALAAMLKTAQLENPRLRTQLIAISGSEDLAEILQTESAHPHVPQVRYRAGRRQVLEHVELPPAPVLAHPWRDNGVYLITGGAGALGLIFARAILRQAPRATVILSGRAAAVSLPVSAAGMVYRQLDVTDAVAVERMLASIGREFGSLTGILHSAGVLRDSYLLKKSRADLDAVLAAKVRGLVNLDLASRALPLELFVAFSSLAGVTGNPGQADYACANSFMDHYVAYRNTLVARGERAGRSLALNWPLWAEGGMRPDPASVKLMRDRFGLSPLASESGIAAFYQALASGHAQVLIAAGERDRLLDLFDARAAQPGADAAALLPEAACDLGDRVRAMLRQHAAELIKVGPEVIEPDVALSEYGYDSVAMTELANKLNDAYDLELTPTLCFEYPSIAAMADYLLGAHPAVFARRFAPRTLPPRQPPTQREQPPAAARPAPLPGAPAPIAVVGISGCMPMAVDLDAFWANLVAERDCISEIPESRWDWKALSGDPECEPNTSTVRWGGFIDGIDEFDPLFFGISPREAEVMDPQQRLLMVHVWKALEDAGHAPESLSGSRTALFVGTGASGYHTRFSAAQRSMDGYSATASVPSIGPNRMSYLLNLRGPSEPIETACSSSLVAVIRGVSVLRDGSCDLAIVGGINTIITPEAHISFNKAGMLSPDGRCKPFAQQANGYARGEGVGMLVLKRLSDAEEAGDHIHGVILGCAENHGGRATSLTAPNPQAQAELLRDAYRRAGIDPRTISYVEAHGTGTRLGDPVEIAGLKAAFGESGERGFCGLGSVKSNIGHLELAAGVAGMLKVLLQMRHKTLVKSLHSEQLNPYFDLADSPFYVVQQTAPWLAQRDAQGQPLPRRAGVSSFGFGGVNAHVLLEEYLPPTPPPVATDRPALIVLSARNEERLLEVVSNLLAFLNRAAEPGPAWLASLACTLQLGRDAMEERLAWSVTTVTELIGNLQAFVARGALGGGMRGQVKRHREALSVLAADEDAAALIDAWVAKGKTMRLLELWTKGLNVGWERLYGAGRPPRLRLPTYPFARERYWAAPAATRPVAAGGSLLHPLLHANTSDFNAQRFTSRFSGQESFLADHRVQGQRVLPGAAYLEMARAAVAHTLGDCPGMVLNHVVWTRPCIAGDTPLPLDVVLIEQNDGRIAFAIQSAAEEAVIHCQGVAEVSASGVPAAVLDLPAVQQRMVRGQLSGAQCYGAFAAMGIDYGPGHRAIAALHVGAGEVLARLSLPSLGAGFVLHPGMLDAAIQSSLGLLLDDHGRLDGAAAMLPFAVRRVDIAAPCATEMWAVVASAGDGLDIALCDQDGRVCVRLSGFRTRPVEAAAPRPPGSVVEAPAGELHGQVRAALRQMVSALIKVNPTDIDLDSELSEYGFDSISLTELANRLNSEFDLDLMPTLFFEFPTIVALAAHLVEAHPAVFARRFGAAPATPAALPRQPIAAPQPALHRRHRTAAAPADTALEPIAIVGMSACMPMAADVDAFWENLLAGRDCISEIPASRWDWQAVYGDPGREANRTNVKWGGFIDGVDQFDPLFFGITPREAEVMDPQQRLLMTHVWKAIEDAGYAAQTLSGSRTALFVGTGASSYGSLLARSPRAHDAFSSTAVVASMGPNRMSYFLNLHGPSEPIETACSSSLVALNRGVAVLRDGSCDMAIVGGVNTMVTPDAHISFSKAGMLSPDGRCRTFSPQANGYVRGEGVGMLVLKRLSDAERAGDPIHGLIRGCAENHGGRASSLTAPNPLAQAALLRETYARAGIDPRSIGYIEAHGTGTRLGDPVEINGLKSAFGELGAQAFCGIGSVKSNIGHLELAAGVAGVIKVLLQMRHRTLVKSLHSEHISPYIELAGSPFYVVQETTPWLAQRDAQGRELPRRAGVSSFGFGGVNAHVLLEEYLPPAREAPPASGRPALIVLSARNEERLQEMAANLLACLRARPAQADDDNAAWLESLAYTLQVGREAMDERLGWAVSSLPQLIDHLHAFVVEAALGSGVRAQVRRHRETLSLLADEDGASLLVDDWLARGKYTRLLEMWARGLSVDWRRLYRGATPRRLSLPSYPFARERYWIDAAPLVALPASPPAPPAATDVRGRVVACVAELSGLPTAGFADDGDLHALGFDSVFLLQLAAALTREFPVLDRQQDGDALLCCSSIAALVAYIEQAGPPAPTATLLVFAPPARQGSEITAQVLRRDARNVLCEALRIEANEPLSLKARVVVDQSHPFLFDHPLDHISGLHLGAAMSEAVKVAHMHRYGLAPETAVCVSTLALDFVEVCRKQPEALVQVVATSAHDEYTASVSQEGRVMVRASFTVHGGAPRPSGASAPPPGLRPASPHTLNKRNEANVLLSEVQGGADRPGCWLLAPGVASFVTDFPGRMIDSVVLAEAARQGLRLFSATGPGQPEPAARRVAQVDLLKTLEVSLQRPLYWDEGVYLELLACDRFEVGSAARLRIDGAFLVAGAQVGRFSASALSLSPALHQQWDPSGRAGL